MIRTILTKPIPVLHASEVAYHFEEVPRKWFHSKRDALKYKDEHNAQLQQCEAAGMLP